MYIKSHHRISKVIFRTLETVIILIVLSNCNDSNIKIQSSSDDCHKSGLIQRVKEGDVQSVLKLGRCGDKTNLLIVKKTISEFSKKEIHPSLVRAYRKAAAKLGDTELRKEILRELDSDDLNIRQKAFEDTCYIGGSDMIVGIAEKLFDDRPGGRPLERNEKGEFVPVMDVSIPAVRHAAVISLSKLIKDPTAPIVDVHSITYDEMAVKKWREWWKKNKTKYR